MDKELIKNIEKYWIEKEKIDFSSDKRLKNDIFNVLKGLDEGNLRVCEKMEKIGLLING